MAFSLAAALAATLVFAPAASAPKISESNARGMVIGGAVATTVTTWAGGMVAARFLDSGDPARADAGRVMAIPVGGPMFAAQTDPQLRVVASLGVYQAASLAVLGVGAVSLSKHHRLHPDRRRWVNRSTGILMVTQGVLALSLSWSMTFGLARERAVAGDRFAQRLQVPVVGGLIAAPIAPSYTRGYLGLTSSAIQLASLSVVVAGAAVLASTKRARNLSVVPMPTRGGGHLVASVRF